MKLFPQIGIYLYNSTNNKYSNPMNNGENRISDEAADIFFTDLSIGQFLSDFKIETTKMFVRAFAFFLATKKLLRAKKGYEYLIKSFFMIFSAKKSLYSPNPP